MSAYLLVVAGIVAGPPLLMLMLKHPYWGALLTVALIPIIPLVEMGDTSLAMVVGLAASLCWAANSLVTRRPVKLPPFMPAFAAYVAIAFFSALLAHSKTSDTARMTLSYMSLVVLTIFLFNVVNSEARLLQMLRMFSLSLTALMVIGLAIFVLEPGLFSRLHGDSGRLDFAVGKNQTSADSVAVMIVAMLPVQAGLFRASSGLTRMLTVAQVPLWIVSLGLVESRSAIAAGFVVVLAFIILGTIGHGAAPAAERRSGGRTVGMFAIMATVMLLPLLRPEYAKRFAAGLSGRRNLWRLGWRVFGSHMLLGVGPGGFAEASRTFMSPGMLARMASQVGSKLALNFASPHNLVLSLLCETGILGLLAFAWFVISVFRTGVIGLRRPTPLHHDPLMRRVLQQLIAGFAGYLAGVMFLSGQRDRLLYVLVSAIAIVGRLAIQPGRRAGSSITVAA